MILWEILASGKRLQKTRGNHHAIHGKIHYFDWAILNSFLFLYQRVQKSYVIKIYIHLLMDIQWYT